MKKSKYLLLLLQLCFVLCLYAQQRGVSPKPVISGQQSAVSNTYAVVAGISNYQDPGIPDLRFADKDAEAFANFLRSNAGGKLDGDHLKVLLNKDATAAQFAIALDWLVEVSKEGDRVLIYFSGHGDVEAKRITQPGYLLCWDAPSRVYLAGGALALPMIQDVISTLSVQNKAKVVVITDACRSGKLAGSTVGGSQITGANLAKQYANEIKILSCQPHEYSIEGEQWGGGRGAFSYNLVNALYGMADQNNDLIVNLQEAGRYLEDHVTTEVAPVSQVPMILGNRSESLSTVDASLLAALKSGKSNQQTMLSSIDARGMEEDILKGVDTSVRLTYKLFKQSLKDKIFLPAPLGEPSQACADSYYEQLIKEPKLERLHSTMRRNYAAALQDDAQQVMNDWMKTSNDQLIKAAAVDLKGHLPKKVFTEKVRSFPRLLDRAAGLLGRDHYMFAILQARKYFFEGYLLANSSRNPNRELGEKALAVFRQSLDWQADLPQAYWQMSKVYAWNLLKPDSAEAYTRKAMELNPGWVLPYTDLAFIFSAKYQQFDRAKQYLDLANQIDSISVLILSQWGIYFTELKKYILAEEKFNKAIQVDSSSSKIYSNLGNFYTAVGRYKNAEEQFKKAIQLDSTDAISCNNLGNVYYYTSRYIEAEQQYKKAIELDSTITAPYVSLGVIYFNSRRYDEAEQQYKKAIELDSSYALAFNNLGNVYVTKRRYSDAEQQYIKAILLDSTNANGCNNLGLLYAKTGRYTEAEEQFKKANQLDSNYANACNNLGEIYRRTRRYAEAEEQFKKAIQLDSNYAFAYNNLGVVYNSTHRYAEAEEQFKKAIQLDSNYANACNNLGELYIKTYRYVEAEQQYKKVIQLDSTYNLAYYDLACLRSLQSQTNAAFNYLEEALKNGYDGFDHMQQDSDLAPLREQKEKWNTLMKKYFPDKMK